MREIGVFLGFDVRIKGGLISMVREVLRANRDLGLASRCMMPTMVDSHTWGARWVNDEGERWLASGRPARLPNFASSSAAAVQLRGAAARLDGAISVVGGGAWSLPVLAARRSLAWVATPFEEEMRARAHDQGRVGRLAFRALVRLENAVEGEALRRVDRVLALSEKTRQVLEDRHELRGMGRLYAPVDTKAFSPGAKSADPVCVMVARLDDSRKDVASMAAAWRIVVEAVPAARLMLIGPAAEDGRARSAVARAGIESSVDFAGPLGPDGIAGHLRAASLFVLTSRQEGLGIVALEAMACATPVVAFTNGGTDELVETSGAGEVVHERTPMAFAQAVIRQLSDGGSLTNLGEAARDFVEKNASREVFTEQLGREYASLGLL